MNFGGLGTRFGTLGSVLSTGAGSWLANFNRLKALAQAQKGIPTAHEAAAMSSPPTVTASTSFPAGVHASTAKLWTTTPEAFQFCGGRVETVSTDYRKFPVATDNASTLRRNVWRVYTRVNSAVTAWRVLGMPGIAYRLLVFNTVTGGWEYVDKGGVVTASTSGINYLKLDFTAVGGKADRLLAIEGIGDSGFTGMYCAFGDVISAPPSPETFRLVIAGDSITDGTAATFRGDGFALRLGTALGAKDVFCSGVPSTGWLNDFGGTRYKLRDRMVADIINVSPNAILIAMGANDTGYTQAALTAEMNTVLDQLRAALPDVPIFVTNGFDANAPSAPSAGFINVSNAAQAACAGRGGVSFIDMTGVAYSKADAIHPNDAGMVTVTNALRDKIRTVLGVV